MFLSQMVLRPSAAYPFITSHLVKPVMDKILYPIQMLHCLSLEIFNFKATLSQKRTNFETV